MCGIFAILCKRDDGYVPSRSYRAFMNSRHRGPDRSATVTCEFGANTDVTLGFHRLAIMDTSVAGMQPMSLPEYPGVTVVCNGEIYNWRELAAKYGFKMHSTCDVEILLHMYNEVGIDRMLRKLDGYFAFVLHDAKAGVLHAARDVQGVRPLFMGVSDSGLPAFASEAKSLSGWCDNISQLTPLNNIIVNADGSVEMHCRETPYLVEPIITDVDVAKRSIHETFERAVAKRVSADRPIACLLSGGLDSSLVAALVARYMAPSGRKLRTFSIGFDESADIRHAREVAKHIGSEHTEILLTEGDFLDAIPEVVKTIESYDITSVRASVGNYLVCKHIGTKTDCRVLFNGDYSDEIFMSYQYASKCVDPAEFLAENRKLVREIHYFDSLRSDRCAARWGLECRTPFADLDFMNLVMAITPSIKMHHDKMEKWILREAFRGSGLIPDSVLFRSKCAFSDGVSSKSRSWYEVIREHAEKIVEDGDYAFMAEVKFKRHAPYTKESYWYRNIYQDHYGDVECIPHFWMPNPKWVGEGVTDPSARTLTFNKE